MAKNIESEYFMMIDQVVIATDANLNMLYNNYHERFYEKIMNKIVHLMNMDQIRMKAGGRLDRCFRFTVDTLDTDPRTMRMLMRMFEAFEFDSTNIDKRNYYENVGILDVLLALEVYVKQYKSAIERKSMKQLNIESRRGQYASMKLIVDFSYPELQIYDPRVFCVHQRVL